MGKIANRQSLAFSERGQPLASHSAGPHGMTTTPTNANRAIRIAVQGPQGPDSVFLVGEI